MKDISHQIQMKINELKQAKKALLESEERLVLAAEIGDLAIWEILDTGERFGNDKDHDLIQKIGLIPSKAGDFGYEIERWLEKVHPEDLKRAKEHARSAFKGKVDQTKIELRFQTLEKKWIWIYGASRIIERNKEGKPKRWVGVHQDITERKRIEEELRRAYDELEQRVKERTLELARTNARLKTEVAERKSVQVAVQKAYEEIRQLKQQLEADNVYLRDEIKVEHNFENIIGQSPVLNNVLFKVEQVAPTDTTVMILGETGTGKELVARAVHNSSSRSHRPLVKVNCAALPGNLIESELFGHEKGAFSGAEAKRQGRFELADKGTLFLDEIAELPMDLQAKLLRVLEEGEFERLGSSHSIRVDVRIISATNRKLEELVRNNQFREDLWYRLNIFPITVPPLRERPEDIPLLINFFVNKFSKTLGKSINRICPESMKRLKGYDWPGNVRELKNVIERGVLGCGENTLRLSESLTSTFPIASTGSRKTLAEMEIEQIRNTLKETGWRIEGKRGAAELLDLKPSTLRARMRKFGITKPWHSS